VLDVDDTGVTGGRAAMLEAFLQEVRLVDGESVDYGRLGLRLTPAQLEELRTRVAELLNDFAERPPAPDGQPYSVFLAIHPDATRD